MRRFAWILAVALLGAPSARAADVAPDGGAGDELVDRCAPPQDLKPELADPFTAACGFFSGLATRDLEALGPHVRMPFYFEGKQVSSAEDVARRWKQLVADLGSAPSTFYGLEVLSYDEMVKKYGKPPAKLEGVPMRGTVIAVANLDGRAEIAALKRDGSRWVVFAFHD